MYEEIRKLVFEEQARDAGFISVDLDTYLDKLQSSAEFLLSLDKGRCQGFIAYYCNDNSSLTAFITLVLIAPNYRRSGLGHLLVDLFIERARRRGYLKCRLEVNANNLAAQTLYRKLGFYPIEDRSGKILMEAKL